ncbi:hypothetical protein, partial [Klebsiella pneumoniae]|uniref:hypothetical protein n=1 Tax=Klebsiella pneumoniae TaxID=573 RepID=UPI0013D4C5C6
MRDIGRALVEIHGQHDDRALVDPGAHRDLLDAFAGHLGIVRATSEAGLGRWLALAEVGLSLAVFVACSA